MPMVGPVLDRFVLAHTAIYFNSCIAVCIAWVNLKFWRGTFFLLFNSTFGYTAVVYFKCIFVVCSLYVLIVAYVCCCLQTARQRTVAWPCGVCAKDAPTDCVLCGTCGRWLHRACECLTHEQLRELHQLSLSYVCSSCLRTCDGEFDFNQGLVRMQQVTLLTYLTFTNSSLTSRKEKYSTKFGYCCIASECTWTYINCSVYLTLSATYVSNLQRKKGDSAW